MDIEVSEAIKENRGDSVSVESLHHPSIDGVEEEVLKKASIIPETGDYIAAFDNVQCLTPRGRFDVKVSPTHFRLHGKTFDNNIPLSTISHLFQVPDGPKQSNKVLFVLSLDTPITQGKTDHHHIVVSFAMKDNITLELQMEQTKLDSKYDGKLKKQMSGPAYEIFNKVVSASVQKKVTLPDESFSESNGDNSAIVCYYKVNDGFLYPLEEAFLFLHRPPIHIPFKAIGSVNLSRTGGSNRMFDLEIVTDSIHSFSQIDVDMEPKLLNFIKRKGIKNGNASSSSGEASSGKMTINDLADDESDPEDESFNPETIKEKDVEEEFDSDVSEDSATSDSDTSDYDTSGDNESSDGEEGGSDDSEETPSKKAKMEQ